MLLVNTEFKPLHVSVITDIDIVGVRITEPCDMYIFCIYKPPLFNIGKFISSLSSILQVYANTYICVGDTNENLLLDKSTLIYDMLVSLGFVQHIQSPTRDCGSLIDHVYSLNSDGKIQSEV